jgi:hypothetical protein
VHLEPRYLTPVVAGSIVIGVLNVVRVIEFFRRPTVLDVTQRNVAAERI